MNINIYMPAKKDDAPILVSLISNLIGLDNAVSVNSINSINNSSNKLANNNNLFILIISNYEDLNTLLIHKNYFVNSRIIIILYNNCKEIIDLAYLLKPTFIDFADSDFNKVYWIIKKINAAIA